MYYYCFAALSAIAVERVARHVDSTADREPAAEEHHPLEAQQGVPLSCHPAMLPPCLYSASICKRAAWDLILVLTLCHAQQKLLTTLSSAGLPLQIQIYTKDEMHLIFSKLVPVLLQRNNHAFRFLVVCSLHFQSLVRV